MHRHQNVTICESQGHWEIYCHAEHGRVLVVRERFSSREGAEAFLARARAALGGSVAGRWYQNSPNGRITKIGEGHFTLGNTFDPSDRSLTAAPYPSPSPVDVFREMGQRGGNAAALVTRTIREQAVKLARELAPAGGWQSAPQAADAIMSELRAYARERNRRPSTRTVADWLRKEGIKKDRRTE